MRVVEAPGHVRRISIRGHLRRGPKVYRTKITPACRQGI